MWKFRGKLQILTSFVSAEALNRKINVIFIMHALFCCSAIPQSCPENAHCCPAIPHCLQ